jgi:hypothetical protein
MANSRFEVLSGQIRPPDHIFSTFLPKVLNLTQHVIALIVITHDLKKGNLYEENYFFDRPVFTVFIKRPDLIFLTRHPTPSGNIHWREKVMTKFSSLPSMA